MLSPSIQARTAISPSSSFQVNDDTAEPAMTDIRTWYQGPVTLDKDLLVINVSEEPPYDFAVNCVVRVLAVCPANKGISPLFRYPKKSRFWTLPNGFNS